MSSRKPPAKKPTGGRPNVGRLFSRGTLSPPLEPSSPPSLPYLREPETSQHSYDHQKDVTTSQGPYIHNLSSRANEVEDVVEKPWLAREFVQSPAITRDHSEPYENSSGHSTPATAASVASPRISSFKNILIEDNRVTPSESKLVTPPLPSPSRARWEQLRQHVLPSVPKHSHSISSVSSPAASFTSFSQLNLPGTRPSTPKLPRLARFGFRQVVVEAREAADDLTRKFSEDIQKACWDARFGDMRAPKPEREPTQGSTLNLPFMSSASLPLQSSTIATNTSVPSYPRPGLKKPASTLNMTVQASRSNALSVLQSVIVRYASVATHKETAYTYLPYEKEVLSVLLICFLSQSTGRIADEERRISLEIFETIVKTWRARYAEGDMDRCLWCCKAATMPPSPLRPRVLLNLSTLLSAQGLLLTTPVSFRTLLPALTFLIPCYTDVDSDQDDSNDLSTIHELVTNIMSGCYGRLDLEDLEQKYQAFALKTDTEDDLRRGICIEAMARCIEFGTMAQNRVLLRVMERYWPSPSFSMPPTPLRQKIHTTKLVAFLHASLHVLHGILKTDAPEPTPTIDTKLIFHMLVTRIIPELDSYSMLEDVSVTDDAKHSLIRVVLSLISLNTLLHGGVDASVPSFQNSDARDLLITWLTDVSSSWHTVLQGELRTFMTSSEWNVIIRIASIVLHTLPDSSRKLVATLLIPNLHERLVVDPPPYTFEPLSALLDLLAQLAPQVFYKPIFICAASTKDVTVSQQFTIIVLLSHYMPQFWTSDAEMISVALMSDANGGAAFVKGKMKEDHLPVWGKPKLGQTIVLFELIKRLRDIRLRQNTEPSSMAYTKLGKFIVTLESRLAILLEAKEKANLIPLSHRTMIAVLFHEMRLISRSLKSPTWLQQIVKWTIHHGSDPEMLDPTMPEITDDCKEEVESTFRRLYDIIATSKEGFNSGAQRRGTILVSPRPDDVFNESPPDSLESLFEMRKADLALIPKNPLCGLFELLVLMSGALKQEDYAHLCPVAWKSLDVLDDKLVTMVSFICMQCAEKAQDNFIHLLTSHMHSTNIIVRRQAVQKLSILSCWRFQLLSLTFLTDRAHRRPFKLARPPISFVPTDVGSSNYVPVDEYKEVNGNSYHALPLDLRRRLSEMGWAEENKPLDSQLEWLQMPMSLLASQQLDRITRTTDVEASLDHSASPGVSPLSTSPGTSSDKKLIRRSSSTGSQFGAKRRPVFVQPLVTIFIQLAKLTMDADFVVATLSRNTLMDFMRDDPGVLCRPIIDILSEGMEEIDDAMSVLRSFLRINRMLPPKLTHHVFNHLAGFLKFIAKESKSPNALHTLAYAVPILAKFTPQVSDMSMRAIRRAKIEVFLFPSASLWFPESAPDSLMFPKGLHKSLNPFDDLPPSLVYMTMIRTSQNLLFVDMLKRNPQDVQFLRKTWTKLVLPDAIDDVPTDSVPQRTTKAQGSGKLFDLSLSFSRSHLYLVAQIFRCMTRHLNDRDELASHLDGVNRILIRHKNDIGIVSHAVIIYMIASTRFRRLMSSGAGFCLFLPTLLKVYCEAEGDSVVRGAIEYATHRFFVVHEEVFIFQMLDVLSNLVTTESTDSDWVASNAFHLLHVLRSSPSSMIDSAGIHDANKTQEEETALAIAADEMPQVFLASLHKDGKASAEKIQSSLSVDIFDSKRFQPDNLVRMLLTVIAHDPSVKRAENFLRLFKFFASHLYNASTSARTVLRDGIDALSTVVGAKFSVKTKVPEALQMRSKFPDDGNGVTQAFSGKNGIPSDIQTMRSDCILLFAAFVKLGGKLRDTSIQRYSELAKLVIRDPAPSVAAMKSVQLLVDQIAEIILVKDDPKQGLSLIQELTPIIGTQNISLDLSKLFQNLATLCLDQNYSNNPKFSSVVVTQICRIALDLCETATSDNRILSVPYRLPLISLLANAVCLVGSDVITELEQRDASPTFLSYILLPLIFKLRTTSELVRSIPWTDSYRRDAHTRAWIRLLAYVMNSTHMQHGTMPSKGTISRSTSGNIRPGVGKDQDVDYSRPERKTSKLPVSRNTSNFSLRIAIALVTLKAIIVRGEDEISSQSTSAWSRLGVLIRSLLRHGNAKFALRDHLPSPFSSPLPSPSPSSHFNGLRDGEFGHRRSSSSTSDGHLVGVSTATLLPPSPSLLPPPEPSSIEHTNAEMGNPRFVDYLMWSLLEFTCLCRSPLVIQLRTFTHEKVHDLSEVLRWHGGTKDLWPRGTSKRKSSRPTSTIFSKPRISTLSPEFPSRKSHRDSIGVFSSDRTTDLSSSSTRTRGFFDVSRQIAGPMALQSSMPTSNTSKGSKRPIIHLGPDFAVGSTLMPSMTQSTSTASHSPYTHDDVNNETNTTVEAHNALALTTLRSLDLTYQTYRRIRIVQASMGYSDLLPLPIPYANSGMGRLRAGSDTSAIPHSTDSISIHGSSHEIASLESENEPDLRAWTKRQAAESIIAESYALLRAFDIEQVSSTPNLNSRTGGLTSTAGSIERNLSSALSTTDVPAFGQDVVR